MCFLLYKRLLGVIFQPPYVVWYLGRVICRCCRDSMRNSGAQVGSQTMITFTYRLPRTLQTKIEFFPWLFSEGRSLVYKLLPRKKSTTASQSCWLSIDSFLVVCPLCTPNLVDLSHKVLLWIDLSHGGSEGETNPGGGRWLFRMGREILELTLPETHMFATWK